MWWAESLHCSHGHRHELKSHRKQSPKTKQDKEPLFLNCRSTRSRPCRSLKAHPWLTRESAYTEQQHIIWTSWHAEAMGNSDKNSSLAKTYIQTMRFTFFPKADLPSKYILPVTFSHYPATEQVHVMWQITKGKNVFSLIKKQKIS